MRVELHHKASLPVRVPRGNQGFWEIICALDASQGAFSIADIEGESNVNRVDIKGYVRALAKAGFLTLESAGRPGQTPAVYRLARRQKLAPRVRPDGSLIHTTAQEQLWTAIRNLKTFDLRDLMFAATTPEVKPTYQATKRFVSRLASAGYLAALRASMPAATWRLKPRMDTGPKPPERRAVRADVMWDPNLKAFVGTAPVAREVSR